MASGSLRGKESRNRENGRVRGMAISLAKIHLHQALLPDPTVPEVAAVVPHLHRAVQVERVSREAQGPITSPLPLRKAMKRWPSPADSRPIPSITGVRSS